MYTLVKQNTAMHLAYKPVYVRNSFDPGLPWFTLSHSKHTGLPVSYASWDSSRYEDVRLLLNP